MSTKYYHAENASRVIAGITFFIYDVSATVFGVLSTDDPVLQAKLDAITQDKKSAVTAISQEEYTLCIKKKASGFEAWSQSRTQYVATPAALKGTGALVVAEPEPEPEPIPTVASVETVEDALNVGEPPVKLPQEPVSEPSRRRNKRSE